MTLFLFYFVCSVLLFRFHTWVKSYVTHFSLCDFSYHSNFKVHSCCQMTGFHCSLMANILYIYHIFKIHSSINGHRLFLHLAIVNNAAVNIGLHISFQTGVFLPLEVKSLSHNFLNLKHIFQNPVANSIV